MKVIKSKRGFTLVELVIVIIIIGILAAVAIPRFRDLAGYARRASEMATATAVRQAITIYRTYNELVGITAINPRFPARLDAVVGTGTHTGTVTASPGALPTDAVPFFTVVMEPGGGITTGWVKLLAATPWEGIYRGPDRRVFGYDSADGSFTFILRAAP